MFFFFICETFNKFNVRDVRSEVNSLFKGHLIIIIFNILIYILFNKIIIFILL